MSDNYLLRITAMRKLLLILVLLLSLSLLAHSGVAVTIPSPSEDFYVLDDANVLEFETEGLIVFTNDLLILIST